MGYFAHVHGCITFYFTHVQCFTMLIEHGWTANVHGCVTVLCTGVFSIVK